MKHDDLYGHLTYGPPRVMLDLFTDILDDTNTAFCSWSTTPRRVRNISCFFVLFYHVPDLTHKCIEGFQNLYATLPSVTLGNEYQTIILIVA